MIAILILIVIVGAAVFYTLYQPKEDSDVVVVPTPSPLVTTEEETDLPEISGVSDLDNIIVGLAQADGSLDQDLAQLEKESNF